MTARRPSLEVVGHALVALVLLVLMWRQVREVDGFFLDEWFYVGAADHMWEHLPFGVFGEIPGWNRGPQRLYPLVLAPAYGLLPTTTAFTVAHLLNVLLLASSVIPAALLARRVIDEPLLRVLAVGLAVAIPWLTISAHLLTENLAFPLYLWAIYAIVRAAERPSPAAQLAALAVIGVLALCRLNLAALFGVLVLAVLAAEVLDRRGAPFRDWARAALRRQAVVAAATLLGLVVALAVVSGGSAALGAYGGLDAAVIVDRLFGEASEPTRRGALTYFRGIVTGAFVMPVVIGLGVALAGVFGRLGPRFVVPSVAALGGLVVVLVVVSVYTWSGALEERYVFPVYSPLAILAVAGIGSLGRIRLGVGISGAIVVWSMIAGFGRLANDSGNFFAAPGGAFWTRVVDHRLRRLEGELFGWAFLPQTGWLLIALAIIALLALPVVLRGRPHIVTWVLTGGLALCGLAQTAALNYDFKQELHGTVDVRGGLARGPDREADRDDFADDALPEGAEAAIIPALSTPSAPYGLAEVVQFWNRDIDVSVKMVWNGAPAPAPPGFEKLGLGVDPKDGLARWGEPPSPYLVMQPDDPRVQFAGDELGRAKAWPYAVMRIDPQRRARWTSWGLEGDGAVLERHPVTMVLDGAARDRPRTVALSLVGPAGASQPARWRIATGGRTVRSGTLAPGATREVRLEVPPCPARGDCLPSWQLTGSGTPTPVAYPAYGEVLEPRPVLLYVGSARFE